MKFNVTSGVGTQADVDAMYELENPRDARMKPADRAAALSDEGLITGQGFGDVQVQYIRESTADRHAFSAVVKPGKSMTAYVRVQDPENGYVREFKLAVAPLTDSNPKEHPAAGPRWAWADKLAPSKTDFRVSVGETGRNWDTTGHKFEEGDDKVFNAFLSALELFDLRKWTMLTLRDANPGDMTLIASRVIRPFAGDGVYMVQADRRSTVVATRDGAPDRERVAAVRHWYGDAHISAAVDAEYTLGEMRPGK